MQGLAYVFINVEQAVRFGHVGWGFALDESGSKFVFGSTDHLYRHPWWDLPGWLRYAHLAPGADTDWWIDTGSLEDMLRVMNQGHHSRYHIRYHIAKRIEVSHAQPDAAVEAAKRLEKEGWSIFVNNCIHQTHRVLTSYGASLPPPSQPLTNLIPKRWFAAVQGDVFDF